jgi:hypothetical protein
MAQHQLSAALFTGVGVSGMVPRDPGRALILEQFSALSGTPEAHLGMGYRYVILLVIAVVLVLALVPAAILVLCDL